MKNRQLLMIPGPIEFDPAVLSALGQPTTSHVASDFIEVFGRVLEDMRRVFLCPEGQPFVLAGSGTLAMDFAAANLTEAGDAVLLVNTGYFSDRLASIFERYGAQVMTVTAPIGGCPALEKVETALRAGDYKILAATHVDTSTGVVVPVKELAALAKKYGACFVLDGVCSVAGEALRMADWGVDLAFTASQKAIGVPPGLALIVAGPAAMALMKSRQTPVMNYYADWNHWLPVMEAYEARKAAYFATPAVNLVTALQVSLEQILKEGLEARFDRHRAISRACKAGLASLGLEQLPLSAEIAAVTMSAPRYPKGVSGAEFLRLISQAGIILAGGLHPAIRSEYFRIGHMGSVTIGDVLAVLAALEQAMQRCGVPVEMGAGLSAAQRAYR